ncbi:OprO/OprP family phosphate-selective porin [Novosphingobium sp. JCM 18896]|uniref:OprO/OprP family phosphate-selective porin n=1 Tax=Novosphingobium sp. JCM 18896 TaxID=2989731 RepID=UPI0022215285|nr:porin [Novosphingobium sp. JCM 18896]MCW1429572.1 porin [Novosphingobium sp. JCM 18896]
MSKARSVSIPAIAVALGWALPSQAQTADTAAVQQELATMRAQMQRMAERIDQLESQLNTANAKADAATQAAASATTAATAATTAAAKAPPIKVAWKGAPELSADGGWSFKPRGRMQLDAGYIDAPAGISAGPEHLGVATRMRRLYFGFEGTMPGGFGYRVEADLGNSDVTLTDVYLTYKANKDITLALGHQKPFWGLEEMTSDNFTSMLERASFATAFGFERRLGLSATYSSEKLLIQGGIFSDDLPALAVDTDRNWSLDGRVVAMPKLGNGTLHLGLSAHFHDLNRTANGVRYRARPFLRTTDVRLVDSGAFTASGERLFGAELAYIAGRLHATGEGYQVTVLRPGLADPTFRGAYAEVGYLLTDDETGYKAGVYDRIKPRRPVGKGGMGALQLNVRYDWLDLADAGINGGVQKTAGVSLIWVPIDYVRFVANYGHMWLRDAPVTAAGNPNYSVDAFGMRAQIDF